MLLTELESNETNSGTCVVLAGYKREMSDFLDKSNQGMGRRFPAGGRIHIDDYTPAELAKIAIVDARRRGYKCQLGLEEAITTLILRKHKDRICDNNASISRDLVSDAISKYNHRVANAGGKPDSILISEDFGIHVVPALSCPCILPGESMNVIFAVPEADHDDAEITARINLTATKAKEDALSDFFTTHKVLFSASLARIPEDLLPSDSVKGPSWEARTFQRGAASSWARKGCLPPDIIEWATTPSAVQANPGRRLSQAAQAKEAPTSSESTSKDALPTEVEMTPEFKRLRSRRRRLFKEATATRRLRERRLTAYSIELTKSTEKVRELQAQVQQPYRQQL